MLNGVFKDMEMYETLGHMEYLIILRTALACLQRKDMYFEILYRHCSLLDRKKDSKLDSDPYWLVYRKTWH